MYEKTIRTIADYEEAISEVRYGRVPTIGEQYQEIYRGQSKKSYELKSGIARYAKSAEDIKLIEENILNDFKELIKQTDNSRKFIQISNQKVDFKNDWRILEQIQHYRLPTRLIDWSLSPNVALFFSVEKNPKEDGQFWIFKSPLNLMNDDHYKYNPYSENLNLVTNSSFLMEENFNFKDYIAEKRRMIQHGKFIVQDYNKSMSPLENQEDKKKQLIKYIIPSKSKKLFSRYLADMNITEKTLYVEYDDEIENIVSEIKRKYNFK